MKTKGNLWADKRKLFIFCIVIVMIVAVAVSFISFFRADEAEEEEEKKPYESMYNASRYFFRVFYPDDWDVHADSYGFLLNPEGLVLELFPLKKIPATPAPTAAQGSTPTVSPTHAPSGEASASATVDPRAGMERNTELTLSFYYKEYDELSAYIETLIPTAAPSPTPVPSPTPGGTPSTEMPGSSASPAQKEPPMALDVIAGYVFGQFQKTHEAAGYGYSAQKKYEAEGIEFLVLPYSYIQDGVKMTGELYVAARAMAYYVVQVDGTEAAFGRYSSVVQNILYNMVFSVFDY